MAQEASLEEPCLALTAENSSRKHMSEEMSNYQAGQDRSCCGESRVSGRNFDGWIYRVGSYIGLYRPLLHASQSRTISLPRDHGKHADFQTEWWYLSGHLKSDNGNNWAYQFTIFRRARADFSEMGWAMLAVSCKSVSRLRMFRRALDHAVEKKVTYRTCFDGYLGHLAITDLSGLERFFWEAPGCSYFHFAGARDDGLGVWFGKWNLEEKEGVIYLQADHDLSGLSLELNPQKPAVIHGIQEPDSKGLPSHGASCHYFITALQTRGILKWKGQPHSVEGQSWLDREFGTNMVSHDVRGWDWMALSLSNGFELMIYLISSKEGIPLQTSWGTIVFPTGRRQHLKVQDFQARPTEFWISPATRANYPVGWFVTVSAFQLEITIEAAIKDHEHLSSYTTIDYWEGPVRLAGTMGKDVVSGKGHLELTGYAEAIGGKF